MYSACSDGGSLRRVAPFRYPRITGYLLLTVAFRSLSRLSSALSAKASTLCSLSLDLKCAGSHTPAFGVASPTDRFLSFALSPMKLKSFSLYFRCLFHPLGLPGIPARFRYASSRSYPSDISYSKQPHKQAYGLFLRPCIPRGFSDMQFSRCNR